MNYDEFKTTIYKQIQELLPSGTNVQLHTVFKNNGIKLDALTISTSQSNISPTIFLNYYYEKREYFPDLQAVCRDILLTYKHHRSSERIDVDFFTDYELVKERLAYRIINYEKNMELLKTVPHIRYLDLAIVFYCLVAVSDQMNATILIHSSHMKLWHMTAQNLYEHTCRTTPNLLPYDFHNMSKVLAEAFDPDHPADTTAEHASDLFCAMYLLTNSEKLYGASCMLYPNLLDNISKKLNADLFVLPSSIHELIILPACSRSQSGQLAAMVTDINRTELAADEVLSNHVYYYSQAEQALSICL